MGNSGEDRIRWTQNKVKKWELVNTVMDFLFL
jgi:hypothetical protein